MSVLLATLCLNEMEWLPRLYEQHRDWPGLTEWVFVEAADAAYEKANPGMVSRAGLSADGTTEFLKALAESDPRVTYVPYGRAVHRDPARGKCGPRQRYLDAAAQVRPEFLVVLDADEFYTRAGQGQLVEHMRLHPDFDSFVFRRREIWRPPSVADRPLFGYEVTGGFWKIPCCHWWRWREGMHYQDCHNTPTGPDGVPMNDRIVFMNEVVGAPDMIHLGFAASANTRLAKNRYYAGRGEGVSDFRGWYVTSRAAWKNWRPGDTLPRDARVVKYTGEIPEVFREESNDRL